MMTRNTCYSLSCLQEYIYIYVYVYIYTHTYIYVCIVHIEIDAYIYICMYGSVSLLPEREEVRNVHFRHRGQTDRPWSTTVDHGQGRPWSTMFNHGRPWSTMVDDGRLGSSMVDPTRPWPSMVDLFGRGGPPGSNMVETLPYIHIYIYIYVYIYMYILIYKHAAWIGH